MSLAGAVALRMLADRSGLTGFLSSVFARLDFLPVHDRGRLLTDLAVALGAGARDIVDVEALRGRRPAIGPHHSQLSAAVTCETQMMFPGFAGAKLVDFHASAS